MVLSCANALTQFNSCVWLILVYFLTKADLILRQRFSIYSNPRLFWTFYCCSA